MMMKRKRGRPKKVRAESINRPKTEQAINYNRNGLAVPSQLHDADVSLDIIYNNGLFKLGIGLHGNKVGSVTMKWHEASRVLADIKMRYRTIDKLQCVPDTLKKYVAEQYKNYSYAMIKR